MNGSMMSTMGGYGNLPSMNDESRYFNDDPRISVMDSQMTGSCFEQERIGQMDQMRQMKMSQMHPMGGPILFEILLMPSTMG